MTSSRPSFTGLKRSLLALLAAVVGAQATFSIVWYLRNPPEEFSEIVSILPFSLLMVTAASVPVLLVLNLTLLLADRFVPVLQSRPLLETFLLVAIGAGTGISVGALMLGQIGLASEFSRIALLGATVGGAIAGWAISKRTS